LLRGKISGCADSQVLLQLRIIILATLLQLRCLEGILAYIKSTPIKGVTSSVQGS